MTDRTLIGRRTDGSYGLDISLPGNDVKTASLQNMAFSTNWSNNLTVHQSGLVIAAFDQTITFPTLPFVPMVYCNLRFNDGRIMSDYITQSSSGVVIVRPWAVVTDSSIYFSDQFRESVENFNVRYYILNIPA